MEELLAVMKILRSPSGCPWDKAQTYQSLMDCLIEEAYEVVDGVKSASVESLREELGDVLCIISMLIVIAEERSDFTGAQVVGGAVEKMRRRHPHVFEQKQANSPEEAYSLWLEAKKRERDVKQKKSKKNAGEKPVSENESALPALLRAQKTLKHAARIGFQWRSFEEAAAKIREETEEFFSEVANVSDAGVAGRDKLEEEFGDALLALVNAGRMKGLCAETALWGSIKKFGKRMRKVEEFVAERDAEGGERSYDELLSFWEQAKRESYAGTDERS